MLLQLLVYLQDNESVWLMELSSTISGTMADPRKSFGSAWSLARAFLAIVKGRSPGVD